MPNIPQQFIDFADSKELGDISEEIGAAFGLNVNQIGEFDAEVRDIITGVTPSTQFVKDIVERLEIDTKKAQAIADEANKKIFGALKSRLATTMIDDQASSINAVEKAGGFSMVPSLASESAGGGMSEKEDVNEGDKADILSGIEDPKPVPQTAEEDHTEALVDHLLGTPSAQAEQKVEHKEVPPPINLPIVEETPAPIANKAPVSVPPPVKTTPPAPRPAPAPRQGLDPYREIV